MLRFLILIFLISIFSVSNSRADKEISNIIGGLAVGLINEISNSREIENNDIDRGNVVWNSEVSKERDHSKTRIQYDEQIARQQTRLKELRYYTGKVDGLNGSGTTQAIKNWENDYSNVEIDGFLDDPELILLEKQYINSLSGSGQSQPSQNNSAVKTSDTVIKHEEPKKQLRTLYEHTSLLEDVSKACEEFRDTGYPDTIYLDNTLQDNIRDGLYVMNNHITKIQKCIDLSNSEMEEIRNDGRSKWRKSMKFRLIRTSVDAVLLNQTDPNALVQLCNTYSRTAKKAGSDNSTFDPTSCTYDY